MAYLNESEAASFLNLSQRTLRRWRSEDKGPSFIKLGGAVRYSSGDIARFIGQGARQPSKNQVTSAQGLDEYKDLTADGAKTAAWEFMRSTRIDFPWGNVRDDFRDILAPFIRQYLRHHRVIKTSRQLCTRDNLLWYLWGSCLHALNRKVLTEPDYSFSEIEYLLGLSLCLMAELNARGLWPEEVH